MPSANFFLLPTRGWELAIGASIVSAATATEIGATGVKRQPWANAPFIPGALADYMDAQFKFYNSERLSKDGKPIMAGLNYFLTHADRGSSGKGLLGEKFFCGGDIGALPPTLWLIRLTQSQHDELFSPAITVE